MRAVSVFYQGMFNFTSYHLPELVQSKKDLKEETEFEKKLKSSMGNDDLICNNIFVHNQTYKNGDIVVVKIEDSDNLTIGLIKSILIKENKVHFVCKCYKAVRNYLQFFESENPSDDLCQFVESSKIADFKPLIMRGTALKFVFVLHHHISFEY